MEAALVLGIVLSLAAVFISGELFVAVARDILKKAPRASNLAALSDTRWPNVRLMLNRLVGDWSDIKSLAKIAAITLIALVGIAACAYGAFSTISTLGSAPPWAWAMFLVLLVAIIATRR